MSPDEEREIAELMRQALQRSRGHANFFQWGPNRDVEEWGIVNYLRESLDADEAAFFREPAIRGRGNDPPDCEAQSLEGERIALEVTELVDPAAIVAFKCGDLYSWAEWSQERLREALQDRLTTKDQRHASLQGGPYSQYILVIHTDEPMLSHSSASTLLHGVRFARPAHIDRAFLLISYDPGLQRCPYIELVFVA
jgi:hypothetical protein